MKKRKIVKLLGATLGVAATLTVVSCGGSSSSGKKEDSGETSGTKYRVYYETDQGEAPESVKTDALTDDLLPELTSNKYAFVGWYLDAAFTTPATTGKINENTTLYAKWVRKYYVSFDTAGGSTVEGVYTGKDGKVAKPADPTREGDAEYVNHKKSGFKFVGWFTEDNKEFSFDTVLTTNETLIAHWDIEYTVEDGYEAIMMGKDFEEFVTAQGAAGKVNDDITSGAFTLMAGTETRSRAKDWKQTTYAKYADSDAYTMNDGSTSWRSSYSAKITQTAGIKFTASGDGVCKLYLQNGSTGAGMGEVGIVVTDSDENKTEIRFAGTDASSPMVQVSFNVVKDKSYTVTRLLDSGTVDLYYAELDLIAPFSAITSFNIINPGKQKFLVGTEFSTAGLSVNGVKDSGATVPAEANDLTITNNVDMTKAGKYTVNVKYKDFEAKTYEVEVFDLEDIELGFNKIEKLKQNTPANNGQYFNQTVQQVYGLNDEIDVDALTINAISSGAYEQLFLPADAKVTLSDVDMTTTGEKTVTVTLTLNGVSKSKTYNIYVVDTAVAKVMDGDEISEANVYVDANYEGVVGAVTTVGAVSKDCNTFKTVQQALDYLGMQEGLDTVRKNVYIAAGKYNEKLEITLPYISLIGLGGAENTIIEWDSIVNETDEAGFSHTTDSTQTVAIRYTAENCVIDGLTISNYYNTIESYNGTVNEANGERGLAVLAQADKMIIQNSRLLGWQDTLELFTGRQLIKDSYISGCVDYIFGTNNTTLFDNCEIHTVKGKTNAKEGSSAAHITAFKGCNKGADDAITYGAIFNNCNFTVDEDFVGYVDIARAWGAYSAVMIMNSKIADKITTKASEAYVDMNAKKNVETLQWFVYNNTKADGTTAWALTEDIKNAAGETINHTITDATVAAKYTDYATIFGTTNGKVSYNLAWNPEYTGVVVDTNTYYSFNEAPSATGTNYVLTGDNVTSESTPIFTVGDITFDGTAGKIQKRTGNNNDLMCQKGAQIRFSVAAGTQVKIVSYPGYGYYKINGKMAGADTVIQYFAEATDIVIEDNGATYYLYSIVITPNAEAPEATVVDNIVVTGQPAGDLAVGTDADLSGLKVRANYSDGTYAMVTDFTTDAATVINKDEAGTYTVTVSHAGKTKTFNVNYVAEVSTVITENLFITLKGGSYSSTVGTEATNLNNDSTVKLTGAEATYNKVTFDGIGSNGNDNWGKITKDGATIKFETDKAATLIMYFYKGNNTATVTAGGNTITATSEGTGDATKFSYAIPAGEVTITLTGAGSAYVGAFEIVFPAE